MDIKSLAQMSAVGEQKVKDSNKDKEKEIKSIFALSSFAKSGSIDDIEAQLSDLRESLSETNSSEMKAKINAQIEEIRQSQRQEIIKKEVDNYLANSNLPKNIASELVSLTLEAVSPLDIAQKSVIDAKIKALAQAYDIDEEEMAKLKPLNDKGKAFALEDLDTQQLSVEDSFNKQISALEEELKHTTDNNTKIAVKSQIHELNQQHQREMMKIDGERFMSETNLPKDVAGQLLNLIMKKTDANDIKEMNGINSEISALVEKYGISDEELSLLTPLNNKILGFKEGKINIEREANNAYFSSQLEQLEEQLSYAAGESQKSAILAMMEQLGIQNATENDNSDLKILELQYSMQMPGTDENIIKYIQEKMNLTDKLSQTENKQQRERIQADIRKLDMEYKS